MSLLNVVTDKYFTVRFGWLCRNVLTSLYVRFPVEETLYEQGMWLKSLVHLISDEIMMSLYGISKIMMS